MDKNLVLGRGEVYFNRFAPGTTEGEGERYLGNTPTFRVQRNVKELARATSFRGRIQQQNPLTISEEHLINFVTDNLSRENFQLWFGFGETIDGGTPTFMGTETHVVRRGHSYQLGLSLRAFVGLRNIDEVVVRRQGVKINSDGNYIIHKETGRLEVLVSAIDLPDDSYIEVDLDTRSSDSVIVTSGDNSVYGSLRYISRNIGAGGALQKNQKDLYFPYVHITPRGQIDFKSDEWQQLTFDAVAKSMRHDQAQLYVTHGANTLGHTLNELAILDDIGDLKLFPPLESLLHQVLHGVDFGTPRGLGESLGTDTMPTETENWAF